MTSAAYCTHGMVQRNKLGTSRDDVGREICHGCGLPTMESVIARGSLPARSGMILTTLPSVPGREIAEVLGLVDGTGHPIATPFSTTAGRGARAMDEAREELRAEASRLGADAVVGIVMSSYAGGARTVQQAVGVSLLGTAVRLAAAAQPSDVADAGPSQG